MKKIFFIIALASLVLGSCKNQNSHNHDEHSHETETHTSATEEHDEATHNHDKNTTADDGHNHAPGEACESNNAMEESHADEIVVSNEQAKASGIVTEIIQPGKFQQVINTSGQILVAQGDESVVVATVAGVINFNGMITEGKPVSKGTTLITISSSNMADGDPVQRAKIAFELAQKEYERQKSLVESKIVSEREFLQTQQNYENARISYEALAKGNSKSGQAIASPMGGYIKNILVNEGDYVTIGQPLVSVTQNRKLFLRAEVSERYYSSLTNINSANFQTPYDNQVYELKQLNGKLLSTGKSADGNSFYIPVTFEFDNKGDIIPGSFVEVYLLSAPINNVIAVPNTALTEEQGVYFVYIKVGNDVYKRQEVSIGINNGVFVEVKSGLKGGENVVIKGAYQVRLASASAVLPAHSHEH